MKKYRGYFIFSGVCVGIFAVLTFALVGYGFLGMCFLALAVLGVVLAGLRALDVKRPKAAGALRRGVWSVVIVCLIAVAVTEAVIISEAGIAGDGEAPEYAIVLGAGVHGTTPSRSLRARLETALEFADDFPKARLVLSGGQGRGEDVTEARCMYDWLVRRGVDPERLLLEERAASTWENLTFSKALMEDEGYDGGGVCIITAGYHIARAKMMAGDAGFSAVTARGAGTGMPVLEVNYYLREAPAIWWYLITR